MTARTVVEHALTALRNVSVPEHVARTTRDIANEIDRAWQRMPLVAGLSGNLVARSELVNLLVGEQVLDPFRRALGSAPLRLRRGPVIRFRALRANGTVVDKTMPSPESRDDDAELERKAEEAREEITWHVGALATAERALPAVVRVRPKPWAVWLWPLRWILGLVHRKALAAWRATRQRLEEAKHKLAGIAAITGERDERERALRDTYYGELRLLCGGGEPGKDVREIELDVPTLPADIELVELVGELRASADVDAVFVVERDALYAPTPDGEQVRLGDPKEVVAELPTLLLRARALTLARRARDKLGAARAEIEGELDRAEQKFRDHLHELGKLALPIDLASFIAAQLARMRPMIASSVNAVIEHASTHMGAELAQLRESWLAAVDAADSSDTLKAAITTIEEQWLTAAVRIADEVRVLVNGGAGGVARDLYTDTVSPLRAHGLPEEHLRTPKRAPEIEPVQVLASLASPAPFTLGGNWFVGLFKSFDTRKTELRDKVQTRSEHIREVAAAEMLDAEPKLHAAVSHALTAQLEAAIELQRSWHQQALADTNAAIAKQREALAPLAKSRDAITAAAIQLGQAAAQLVAEQPAVAAAAVAAAS